MMLCSGTAIAQSYMTFYDTDGTAKKAWNLLDVGKVTFDQGDIVVTHSAGIYSVSLNEVLSIKFTDTGLPHDTGLEKISGDEAQLRIAAGENAIHITGASAGQVAIWAMTGQQIYSNRNWRGGDIDISHLDRGIYIITINNSTFKFKK
jgi:hypothetical protein